jgi:hypothetical protein
MAHPGLKRLIAYREGALPEAEREALQEHLSLCRRCTGLLRDLKDFAAAAAAGEAAGPESLREAAWASLAGQLPREDPRMKPPVRQPPPPRRPVPSAVYGAAAVLLLAVLGLSLWTVSTIRQERRRLALVERQLAEREQELAAAREQSPPGRLHELEKKVAELTSALEELRRAAKTPEKPDHLAAASPVEASVAPRFALRGQESPESGFLRGDGAVNPVRIRASGERFTVTSSLAGHPAYDEYRCELLDRSGAVLWSVRRPGSTLLGDAGTAVSVKGLGPGLYRLRIAGLRAKRWAPLGEYLLEVRL